MLAKQPFARRIVIAFTLMTLVVSGVFSLGIVAVVYFVESQLVTEELSRELDIVLHEDLPSGRPPRLDAQTRFFSTALPDYPLPEGFAIFDRADRLVISNQRFRELNSPASRTTAPACRWTSAHGSSVAANASTPSIPARASAWPWSRTSSTATAANSAWASRPWAARLSRYGCAPTERTALPLRPGRC